MGRRATRSTRGTAGPGSSRRSSAAENIAVAPNRQGSGIGALLLNKAEEQAHASGLPEIRLYTNQTMTENLTYYTRHGYHETHRTTQDGYCRVYFVKTIHST